MTTNLDPTAFAIGFDPLTERMTGFTNHKHMFFDVPFMTEVAPNLWQGGCQRGLVLPVRIKHLLSLYQWEAYTVNHKLRTSHTVTMYDALDQATHAVDVWARWVNARRRTGAVLVHCQAGLNRSSLVTARALMLEGMTARQAIGLIREKRSPASLCNKSIEDYLLSL
jgi:protein-tyrosine phosphatase